MTPAMAIDKVSAFPPSFDGNPWTFGGALFSLTIIAALSLLSIGQLCRESATFGWRWREPVGVVRIVLICFFATFFTRAAPDVVFLLSWGEVRPQTAAAILLFKRNADFFALAPFLTGCAFMWRGRVPVGVHLAGIYGQLDLWPTWAMARRTVGVVALVFLIAAGVTIAK